MQEYSPGDGKIMPDELSSWNGSVLDKRGFAMDADKCTGKKVCR